MPRIHNWEDWDDVEDKTQNEIIRQKRNKKVKNKKEENEKLQQNKKQFNNRNNTKFFICLV